MWLQRWVVVGSIAFVLLGAIAYQMSITPKYTSSVTVLVNPALTTPTPGSGLPGLEIDPAILQNPAVVDQVTSALGTPYQLGTASVSVSPDRVVITSMAGNAADAQALANAYGTAVAFTVSAQVPDYLNEVDAAVDAITQQVSDVAGGTTNELLQQARNDVIVGQYTTALTQQSAIRAAVPTAVSVASLAPPGSLATVSLTLAVEVALLAGLLVGVGLALIRNWLDGRIVDVVDVQNAVNAPVVGALPLDRGLSRVGHPTVDPSVQSTGLVEDIRRMRTATTGVLDRRGGSVVLVTGLRKSDGASFVAANLGAASARAGSVSVVASGDLRDPGLAEYFGIFDGDRVSERPVPGRRGRARKAASQEDVASFGSANGASGASSAGLADASAANESRSTPGSDEGTGRARIGLRRAAPPGHARMRTEVDESGAEVVVTQYEPAVHSTNGSIRSLRLRPTGIDGLSMLMSLVGPGQDADALASERTRTIIDATRARAGLVVIDSPPLFDVADSVVLAKYADLVIVVARSNRTRRKELAQAVGILTDSGVSSVGVVVNSIRSRRQRKTGTPISPDQSQSFRRRHRQDD